MNWELRRLSHDMVMLWRRSGEDSGAVVKSNPHRFIQMKRRKRYICIINLYSDPLSYIVEPRTKWKPTVIKSPKSSSQYAEKLCAGRGPWRLVLLSVFLSSSCSNHFPYLKNLRHTFRTRMFERLACFGEIHCFFVIFLSNLTTIWILAL